MICDNTGAIAFTSGAIIAPKLFVNAPVLISKPFIDVFNASEYSTACPKPCVMPANTWRIAILNANNLNMFPNEKMDLPNELANEFVLPCSWLNPNSAFVAFNMPPPNALATFPSDAPAFPIAPFNENLGACSCGIASFSEVLGIVASCVLTSSILFLSLDASPSASDSACFNLLSLKFPFSHALYSDLELLSAVLSCDCKSFNSAFNSDAPFLNSDVSIFVSNTIPPSDIKNLLSI